MRFELFSPICELQMAALTISTSAAEYDRGDIADISRTSALNAVLRAKMALAAIEGQLSQPISEAA